jgi:hypothetical protein
MRRHADTAVPPTKGNGDGAEPLVLINDSPYFPTERLEQAFYQLLQNSPTEIGAQVPGIGAPTDVAVWHNRKVETVRHDDPARFPEIRLLKIKGPELPLVLLKICTPERYKEELTDLLKESPSVAHIPVRRVLLMLVDKPFSPVPQHGVEIYTTSPYNIKYKLRLLERIQQVTGGERNIGSIFLRSLLFPYATFAAFVISITTIALALLNGASTLSQPLVVAFILSVAFLAPRLVSTIWVYFQSRFREWRPSGWAAGATIRDTGKPLTVAIAISMCPICGGRHLIKSTLQRFSVLYRFVPAWIDPFAPSLMSSPRTLKVWVMCPDSHQRFTATIKVRDSGSEITVPSESTEASDTLAGNCAAGHQDAVVTTLEEAKITEVDEILVELRKKTIHGSLEVGREFAKSMASITAGLLPLYLAALTFISRTRVSGGPQFSWVDIVPCAFLIVALFLFIAAYLPRVSTVLLESPDEWQHIFERGLSRRHALMVSGVVVLIFALILMVFVLLGDDNPFQIIF